MLTFSRKVSPTCGGPETTTERTMTFKLLIAAMSTAAVALSTAALAQPSQFGTAQEAKAMLDKAVAAVKTDKDAALTMFNKGEGGFKDRDLYPFCFNLRDGKFVAAIKQLLGTDARTLKDPTGKVFGPELYAAAQKPGVTEVSYMFPRPGGDKTPVPKITFITRAGDLGCGVGYYK
jgi:cache domain-containing protein